MNKEDIKLINILPPDPSLMEGQLMMKESNDK